MLARGDSQGSQSLPAASPPPFPAWARAANAPESDAEAAFLAGAALARLDTIVKENPPWTGVWRKRLALSAAASVLRAGRNEDETALRDAFHLTRPGADPGPAGRRLLAWRALTTGSAGQWRSAIARAADALDVRALDGLPQAIDAAEACAEGHRLAPFAAARAYHLATRALTADRGRGGAGELLAGWLADAVLAQRLNWPFALPLLAASLSPGAGRRPGGVDDPPEGTETTRVVIAYAKAAARTIDLAGDLARRAEKLA